MYPLLEINLDRIECNTRFITGLCREKNIKVMGVTKGACAMPEVAAAMVKGGAAALGDARLKNIAALKRAGFSLPVYLIRIPMISEVPQLVELAEGSLNSEVSVIRAISGEAVKAGKMHNVILMVDVGDLREGVLPEDAVRTAGEIIDLPGVRLEGIGTNLGCYGGVIATGENTGRLAGLARDIERRYGIKLATVSGGTSATLPLMREGGLAEGVNQLRIGEGILLGTDPTYGTPMPGLKQDTMILRAEVVEAKTKPSMPIGEIGKNSFGEVPVYVDKGLMKRVIVAVGKQDCRVEGLTPLDERIEIIGASSDHMILDVTSAEDFKPGDIIGFRVSYAAMLSLMTSAYVDKKFI